MQFNIDFEIVKESKNPHQLDDMKKEAAVALGMKITEVYPITPKPEIASEDFQRYSLKIIAMPKSSFFKLREDILEVTSEYSNPSLYDKVLQLFNQMDKI